MVLTHICDGLRPIVNYLGDVWVFESWQDAANHTTGQSDIIIKIEDAPNPGA